MMKTWVRCLCAVLLLCSCLMTVSCNLFKSDEERIVDRIHSFLQAYNDGDFEDILECLEPKTRNAMEGAMGILGSFMGGISFGDLFGVAVGFASDDDLLNVKILSMEVDGDQAEVILTLIYEDRFAGRLEEKTKFLMVKDGRDWYIKDMLNVYD